MEALLKSPFFVEPISDEYILPRIAERELRRFANLRLSSSRLGATIPLHMVSSLSDEVFFFCSRWGFSGVSDSRFIVCFRDKLFTEMYFYSRVNLR